jgi:hypothetical protein
MEANRGKVRAEVKRGKLVQPICVGDFQEPSLDP